MAGNSDALAADGPHRQLKELTERLTGRWHVTGPGIDGDAEFRPMQGGHLLVADVDFVNEGTRIKLIQHIAYDQPSDTLQARYMDTMGDDSLYTWVLDGRVMRVSHGDKDSAEYFEARFSDDHSEYTGTWHSPDSDDDGATTERITYQRAG